MKTRFNFPTRILFGQGVIDDLPAELTNLNTNRPLLITDSGLMSTGIPERIMSIMKGAGLVPALFSAIEANPNDQQVESGKQAYLANQSDCIVAVGGGSPMDAGKAIQIRIHHQDPLEEYDDLKGGDAKIIGPMPPLIAIPTTAGTGSEVSRSAVITVAAADRKVVLFSPRIMPSVAVCDPELTYGLPARITAETGMDALSHNLEAYLSQGYHPMADGISLQAIHMIANSLPKAVQEGSHRLARQEMLMASSMGAVAFQKGLGVIHSLAHPLSTVSGLSHGLANSILMPHAVRFNGQVAHDRIVQIAEALGALEPSVEGAAQAILALASQSGLPTKLQEAGVTQEQFKTLVEKAMQDGCHQCNPRPCDPEHMHQILQAAF